MDPNKTSFSIPVSWNETKTNNQSAKLSSLNLPLNDASRILSVELNSLVSTSNSQPQNVVIPQQLSHHVSTLQLQFQGQNNDCNLFNSQSAVQVQPSMNAISTPSFGIPGNNFLLSLPKHENSTQPIQIVQPSISVPLKNPVQEDSLTRSHQQLLQFASMNSMARTNPGKSSCITIQHEIPPSANVSILNDRIMQIPFNDSEKTKTEKKRKDRNLREQKRSIKISKQIDHLRGLLQESGAQVKPNKHSVLSSVVSYIRQLQRQTVELDNERQSWVSELQASKRQVMKKSSHNGLDYQQIFNHGGLAAAVATIDGRFVDSNKKFEEVTGYAKEDILKLTLFNLTAPHDLQRMFSVVGQMLNNRFGSSEYICEYMLLKPGRKRAKMSLSLVRGQLGQPKFFHCIMLHPTSKKLNLSPNQSLTSQILEKDSKSSTDEEKPTLLSRPWKKQKNTMNSFS